MAGPPTLQGVEAATDRIRGVLRSTPILTSTVLDRRAGVSLALKAENLQVTGAFKVRGALAAMTVEAVGSRSLVTASAGNFGQGVAFAAAAAGRQALVVVPEGAPRNKVERIRRLGGTVRSLGCDYDASEALARDLARREGLPFLPPFDHPRVIEGQGTAVLELLREVPELDALVVPCGGGGLLAGAIVAAESVPRPPRVVAAEPVAIPSLSAALERGEPDRIALRPTVADGVAVRRIGKAPWAVVRRRLAGVVRVSESAIIEAIALLALETKQVVEGAGAVALAAALTRPRELTGCRRVGVLVTGGNIDPGTLARLLAPP